MDLNPHRVRRKQCKVNRSMVNRTDIVVSADSDDQAIQRAARQLADKLELSFQERPRAQQQAMTLALREDRLELRDSETKPGRGVSADFSALNPHEARRRGVSSHNQPLARAIGKDATIVLDATAGLGHDSALLACLGYRVVAVERSPIMAALLRDGLRRALEVDAVRDRFGDAIQIIDADARDVLNGGEIQPDAVYIDPMFPPRRKASALSKKSIRLARAIVGDDEDAAELVETARRRCRRVVVKRPTYAAPLAAKPTASITGKLVRYDLYAR